MTTFSYQWESANADGTGVADIAGESGTLSVASPGSNSDAFVLPAGQIGKLVRMRVTDGTTTKYSPWSAVVAAAPSGLIDDKRAIHMTAISSVGSVINPDGSPNGQPDSVIVRSQSPAGFWTSLIYTNDDVSLISDAKYTQIYRFRTNGNSRNPYWSSPTTCNTELVWDRPLSEGQIDWYWFATKHEPTWDYATKVDWHSIFQFHYPTIATPPIGLYCGYGDHIFVQRYCGLVTGSTAAEFDLWNVDTVSRTQGHWIEHVIGMKSASDDTGWIIYKNKVTDLGETSFTEHLNVTGIKTWQWGGALNVPQHPSNFVVNDKLDSYYGYKSGLTDADIGTNYIQHTGHVRVATEAEALALSP